MQYKVLDSEGNTVCIFQSYKGASSFMINKPGWRIEINNKTPSRRPTKKMIEAVSFVENILNIEFEGNIKDFYEVSDFLSNYLDEAKDRMNDLIGCSDCIY